MALAFYRSFATSSCSINSFLMRKRSKTLSILKQTGNRLMATKVKSAVPEDQIVKSVYISQSNDIFTNLALEDWLYKNYDFTNHHVLLLWRNKPCVVIGRHQNPWIEANFSTSNQQGIELARRNSGGGTVYHDMGNLNLTFFTPVERYNRRHNLEILARSIERGWNVHPEINKKEDIVIDSSYKISGTASKLGRPNSYHHCTLLVNVDKKKLSEALGKNKDIQWETTATMSIPSPTVNLSEVHSGITMDGLITAVGWEYLRTSPITQNDQGWEHTSKQRGFQLINPTDEWFPGLEKIRSDYHSWDWRYGKTPNFVATKEYDLESGLGRLSVGIEVKRGVVGEVVLSIPPGVAWGRLTGDVDLVTTARGQRFTPAVFSQLEQAIKQQGVAFQPARTEMAL